MDQIEVADTTEGLEKVSLEDYRDIPEEIRSWIVNNQELPRDFLDRLKNLPENTSIENLLKGIRNELTALYGNQTSQAQSFEESRFTPVTELIDKKIRSCGALTSILGTALRGYGVPVRYVHGRMEHSESDGDRHAWLQIYDPIEKRWVAKDTTTRDFKLPLGSQEIKIYHDWAELQQDYKQGNY